MTPHTLAGKYAVQEEIARGGMGVIYRALDRALNRVVAIKQIHAHLSGDSSFAERFMREARAMARLQHDNIVTIYSVEEDRQSQLLVMEFFGPSNLRTLIRQPQRLPLHTVVRIGHQLASALAYAHNQSIIHRDIKPANVLIDKWGKVKLTDFGIAAALDEASMTMAGQVIGTPEYMSPEQARGSKLDRRSDLYSLGIMLYEMVTGKPYYADTSKTAILGKLVFEQHELILQFPPDVPSLIQGVIRDLLRRNPEERISDAETLASQLHEISYALSQVPSSAAPSEESTVVSESIDPNTDAPTRLASQHIQHPHESPTRTMLQPRTEVAPLSPPSTPAATPTHAEAMDETTVLPPQLPPSPPYRPSGSSIPPPITPPTTPSASFPQKLKPIIAGGFVLIGSLSGLIYYLASPSVSTLEQSAPAPTAPAVQSPSQSDSAEQPSQPMRPEHNEELQKQRQQLADETARLEEKKRQADAQQAKEDAERREQERLQALRVAQTEARKRKAADAEVAQPKSVQTARAFPDAQLQSLLKSFRAAYERRDLTELQSLSRMDERRLMNVEFMFSQYTHFQTALENITPTTDGATATFVLQTGTRPSGETIMIPPLSSRYTLRMSRQGEAWSPIEW